MYVWSLQPGGIRGNRCVDGTVLQPCAAEQLELHALDRLDGAEREHHGADGGLRRRFVGIAGGKLFGEDDGTERAVDRDVGQLRPGRDGAGQPRLSGPARSASIASSGSCDRSSQVRTRRCAVRFPPESRK